MTELEVKYMRCPACKTEIEPGTKSCPKCGRLIVLSSRDRLFSDRREYSGVLHQQGNVLVDEDFEEDVEIKTEEQNESLYSDVLRSQSPVDIEGVGSRMSGEYRVPSIRHTIAGSDHAEENTRCPNCHRAMKKTDRFCRNCGTRFP